MNIQSHIARVSEEDIVIRGYSLPRELIGNATLCDMLCLVLHGHLPQDDERRMLDAILVTLVEHGHTPSTIAARETYLGAPEAFQAAVAAGLLGAGSVFLGSMEGAAQVLQTAVTKQGSVNADWTQAAAEIVSQHLRVHKAIPGLGHPIHKAGDPRARKLFEIARETGKSGPHVELLLCIEKEVSRQRGKLLPINATGAIGAIASDMGFDWRIMRGFGLVARTIGLVGHLYEEMQYPIATSVWNAIEHAHG